MRVFSFCLSSFSWISRIIFAFLFFVVNESWLGAADAYQHPLTLAELVDIALKNNPSTKQAWWNAQRASAAVGSAQSEFYPKLDAQVEGMFGKEHILRNGPQAKVTSHKEQLLLSMMLCDCGKTQAAVASTKQALLAASWASDWNIQKVLVRVFESAYKQLHAQETHEATLLSLKEAEKMYEAASELHRVGLKPISDLYTARANFSLMKIEEKAKKEFLRECEADLALSLGLRASDPLALCPVDISTLPKKESIDELIECAELHRADLHEKEADHAALLLDEEKEEASFGPQFSLFGIAGKESGETNRTHHKSDPSQMNHRSICEEKGQRSFDVGVKMEIPLFTGFEATYKKQGALAAANAAQAEIEEKKLEISRDVVVAKSSLESALEMIPFAEEQLENAKNAYEAVFLRYIAGEAKMVELSTAQGEIASARIQYSDVKTQALTSMAHLAYATGTLQ